MIGITLCYFFIQTALLSLGFIFLQEWVFPLLAVVNLVSGPAALVVFAVRRKSR
jgi:hypothetical protein